MSNKYPTHCPHCLAETSTRANLWSDERILEHGIYTCGTNIRNSEDLRDEQFRTVGSACLAYQLDNAITAIEQAIPIVVAHQRHTSEGECTLNLMRHVVDRHNANIH